MTKNETSLIAGLSEMTFSKIDEILLSYNIHKIKHPLITVDKLIQSIFNKFEPKIEKKKVTLKINKAIRVDDNLSLRLKENGCIEVIEHKS